MNELNNKIDDLIELLAKYELAKVDTIPWSMQMEEKRITYRKEVQPLAQAIQALITEQVRLGSSRNGQGQAPTTPKTDEILGWWANDIKHCFVPICHDCKRRATVQTYKGSQAQKNLHRPVNWDWYCKKHADERAELEREAMYG